MATSFGQGYFFWGQPVRVTVDCTQTIVSETVPVQIELKPGGLKDVDKMSDKIAAFAELLDVCEGVGKGCSSTYGMLLAANYYAYDYRHEPIEKIPLEVAHANPAGASVFGYDFKPYKGYVFKMIPTGDSSAQDEPEQAYSWSGGRFKTKRCCGVVLAVPVDPRDPAVLCRWNDLYVNYADCSSLESIPSDSGELSEAGWVEVR